MRKRILCFGDSNTYGYIPAGGGKRYSSMIRWPRVLSVLLGEDYEVIEEGLGGRTINVDPPDDAWKNGMRSLYAILSSHRPLDLVIVMLGTNDLKNYFRLTEKEIAGSAGQMVLAIQEFLKEKQGFQPDVLLMSPARLHPSAPMGCFGEQFDEESVRVSRKLEEAYKNAAAEAGALFLDIDPFTHVSADDGVHLDAESHIELAYKLSDLVRDLYRDDTSFNVDARTDEEDFFRLIHAADRQEKVNIDPLSAFLKEACKRKGFQTGIIDTERLHEEIKTLRHEDLINYLNHLI